MIVVADDSQNAKTPSTSERIADYKARFHEAVVESNSLAQEKQHAKGKKTARE